jgi:hypothetical protein
MFLSHAALLPRAVINILTRKRGGIEKEVIGEGVIGEGETGEEGLEILCFV